MKLKPLLFLPLLLLASCGVPRAALQLSQVQAGLKTDNFSQADVATALRGEAEKWQALSEQLYRRELGGILFVDQRFVELVHQTAAEARRLRALMDAGQDDAALRRELLDNYQKLWGECAGYLSTPEGK